MNSTNTSEAKTVLTPAGAVVALLCFFLPWVKFSCAGVMETASGARLAGEGEQGFLWLILIAALAILGAFVYAWSRKTIWKCKTPALISSAVALFVLVYEYVDFVTGMDVATEFGRIRIVLGQSVLRLNYPNLFNPETWLPYELSESADVTFRIFDTQGRLVRTLSAGY